MLQYIRRRRRRVLESTGILDSTKTGKKMTLMSLPKEIRDQIFSYLAEPEFKKSRSGQIWANWKPFPYDYLPTEIRCKADEAYYGTRQLIIDLPDFEPRTLRSTIRDGIHEYQWPSEIHFHDPRHRLSFRMVPSFLAPTFTSDTCSNACSAGYVSEFDVCWCPFGYFKEITINIPPPKPGDIAHLIMNWNRLRCIGQILSNRREWGGWRKRSQRLISNTLPPVNVMFLEDPSTGRSWFDLNGDLTCSIPMPATMCLGNEKEHQSDLLILLRALAPVRGSRRLTINPVLPERVRDLRFSVTWLSNPLAHQYRYGEYIDAQWNDFSSFTWLTRCEILFHSKRTLAPSDSAMSMSRLSPESLLSYSLTFAAGIMHQLNTPIAPFLRIEQMSSVAHDIYRRLVQHAAEFEDTSQLCRRAPWFLHAILRCSFTLSPLEGRGVCLCPPPESSPSIRPLDYHPSAELYKLCCKGGPGWYVRKGYMTAYRAWKDEFHAVKSRLEDANGISFGPFFGTGELIPVEALPALVDQVKLNRIDGFAYDKVRHSTTAFDFNYEKFSYCSCFGPTIYDKVHRDTWAETWRDGIVHDKGTLLSSKAAHHCPRVHKDADRKIKEIYLAIS